MRANEKTEAAVMDTMNKWRKSYAARDIDAIMALYAPDPGVVLIGTGANERCVGPTEIKALHKLEWSQSEAGSIELGWHSVSAAASMACVAMEVTVHVRVEGQEMHLPARITAVLEQRGDTWLILQLHGSLPAAEQEEGQAWPTSPAAAIEENKAIARRLAKEGWTNPDVLDQVIAPDILNHGSKVNGLETYRREIAELLDAFPDSDWTIDDIVAEKDEVVLRWTWNATHRGEWAGLPPTNKHITIGGVHLLRIAGGKVAEQRVVWSTLRFFHHLGVSQPWEALAELLKSEQE